MIGRREFITLLGGAAAAWPLAARAQQAEQARRVGMLLLARSDDAYMQVQLAAFREALAKLRWPVGRNLYLDYSWVGDDLAEAKIGAADLLSRAPDVVFASASPMLAALHQATRTVPIVFVLVTDPIAQGFVQSLAHPGGNATGFTNLESSFGAKWPEMLKEVAPRVRRVALMFSEGNSGSTLLARVAAEAASMLGLEASLAPVRGPVEIEASMTAVGREPGGGLVIPPDGNLTTHRGLIAELAARFALPVIASVRGFPDAGALASYGVNGPAQYRQAAAYVDRILGGEKPGDLPVQQPTTFELVINLETAKALGLTVPPTLLARADEVIE
jgi:putative ABC transport system substrate-binding protein